MLRPWLARKVYIVLFFCWFPDPRPVFFFMVRKACTLSSIDCWVDIGLWFYVSSDISDSWHWRIRAKRYLYLKQSHKFTLFQNSLFPAPNRKNQVMSTSNRTTVIECNQRLSFRPFWIRLHIALDICTYSGWVVPSASASPDGGRVRRRVPCTSHTPRL